MGDGDAPPWGGRRRAVERGRRLGAVTTPFGVTGVLQSSVLQFCGREWFTAASSLYCLLGSPVGENVSSLPACGLTWKGCC